MTTINLLTHDQSLIAMHRVKIASGDVESVKLCVEFDEVWDIFPNRSASFYNSTDSTVYEAMLVDNECIVPHEVLANAGVLFVAITGASLDGNSIKTTTEAKYRVFQGATRSDLTLAPSKDLFQQYLGAISDGLAPHIKAMNDKVDEKINQINAVADSFVQTGTVLWKKGDNPVLYDGNPMEIDLSEYKRFKILFQHTRTNDEYSVAEVLKKDIWHHHACVNTSVSDMHTYSRSFLFTDTSIQFGLTKTTDISGNDNTTDVLIPVEIIGFKN